MLRFYLQNENTKCKYLCTYDIFQDENGDDEEKEYERMTGEK